jgi:predicted aspartyl protease
MIRYTYTPLQIPAPFVHVTLHCPQTGARAEDVPAQVDTAADRTILPSKLVEEMGLAQMGRIPLVGFGGRIVECPTYSVEVGVRSLPAALVKVAASDGETYILLGRDVLNLYRIVLDGPKRTLEIS